MRPSDDHRQIRRWLALRGDWAYVDYARVSYDYRCRGIATRMYLLTAAWLGLNRRQPLHASSVQTPEAASLWESFQGQDLPLAENSDGKRTYTCLDYSSTLTRRLQAKRILKGVPLEEGAAPRFKFKVTDPHRIRA